MPSAGGLRPKPRKPKNPPAKASPGNIRLNPITAYVIRPMATIRTFLNRILTVFFVRPSPASRVANPGCMMNTSAAAISTQRLSIANCRSVADGSSCASAGTAASIPITKSARMTDMVDRFIHSPSVEHDNGTTLHQDEKTYAITVPHIFAIPITHTITMS